MFTAHRELGGFFYGDKHMERAARKNYERFLHVASLLGVDYCGSNPGAVYRDKLHLKESGTACFLRHLKELTHLACEKGLKGLTIEPMSCAAEPPTFPEEIDEMLGSLKEYCDQNRDTVPVYLCGDISHGYADVNCNIVYSNQFLFEHGMKYMAEFHFKNTDRIYNSTFGFSPEEQTKGIVNLRDLKRTISEREGEFPVSDVVGYLEISGPKTGRDYSDATLAKILRTSLRVLKETFAQPVPVL
jgi:ribulose-phosphate 3-epimerase